MSQMLVRSRNDRRCQSSRRMARQFTEKSVMPTDASLASIALDTALTRRLRAMFAEAKALTEKWLPNATDELLSSKRDFGPQASEHLGTQLMRAILHTWFHTGEVNGMRQMLGHPEIQFVGRMKGQLEYGGVV